jgi:hypothetical protein
MRKLAFLFAAALFVSAPLIAATPSITYAAAKKKASAKGGAATSKGARSGGGGGGGEEGGGRRSREPQDLNEVNSRFARAINDLAISLSKPWPTEGTTGGQTGFTAGRGTDRTAGAASRRGGAGPRGTQSQ